MAVSEQVKQLVAQMPDPDEKGMYCTDIDKEKIERLTAEIARGGRQSILGVIDLLAEPGSPSDVKPHYALHCLANHALQSGDERARRDFASALASQLASDRPKHVRAYLCQELQWAGHKESMQDLANLLADEDLVDAAAMALVAIKDGAAEALRGALPDAKGRCRLVIIHSLAALADAASVHFFRDALNDPDREVRIAAGAGLARVGDPGDAEVLLKAADKQPGWERIQATKHCLLLAERLAAAGRSAAAATMYKRLRDTRTDPSENYIREAAEKALTEAT